MDNTITINFRGICTQMIANNTWVSDAPKLDLRSEGRPVAIRVFLADSELISSEIDPEYQPPHHWPVIRFETTMVSNEVRRWFPNLQSVGDRWCEAPLPRAALEFGGVIENPGVIEPSFEDLPSVYRKTPDSHPRPKPRPGVLNGFPRHAHAYVDLLTGFRIGRIDETDEVTATLTFDRHPELILKPHNIRVPGLSIPLNFGTIEIRNLPDPGTICSPYDYLLHYFATTANLKGKPPLWKDPPGHCLLKQEAREEDGPPISDVYCSSSGYP